MTIDNTDQKFSYLVEDLFPQVYRDDGPLFVEFVKAYYQWLERPGNAKNENKLLRALRDIDLVEEQYLDYHAGEMLASVPKNSRTNRRVLVKNILDFYRSRGTVESFETLFRVAYGANVEIYYPYNDTLIASGSKWYVERALRVSAIEGTVTDLTNQLITGSTSGATCFVDAVYIEIVGGVQFYRLVVSEVDGTFQVGENIINESGNIIILCEIFAKYVDINGGDVPSGGGGGGIMHRVGDHIDFISSLTGVGATGTVLGIDNNSAVKVSVQYGGGGYSVGNTTITIVGNGTNASAVVGSLSNTSILELNDQFLSSVAAKLLDAPDWGVPFVVSPVNVNTALTDALTYQTVEVGRIASIRMNNYGVGYSNGATFNVTARDSLVAANYILDLNAPPEVLGESADLTLATVNGAITSIRTDSVGFSYVPGESLILRNTRAGTVNAEGIFVGQTDPMLIGTGYYVTNRGHLSENKYIQDNDYYQKFSYEVRSALPLETYRDVVEKTLHPAGSKLFGRLQLVADLQVPVTTVISVEERNNGTGDIMIPGNTELGYYESNSMFTLVDFDEVTLSEFGTNAMGVGIGGTIFESEIADGDFVKIIPSANQSANATVQTRVISSNTILVLRDNYPFGSVANADFSIFK